MLDSRRSFIAYLLILAIMLLVVYVGVMQVNDENVISSPTPTKSIDTYYLFHRRVPCTGIPCVGSK